MRSIMITAAAVVAGIFLVAPMATADEVQEQLRLMEQRMAEMEDRLQATSEELDTAKTTVAEQQSVLTDAGLAADDSGVRSGVGDFMKQVDISGVVAASYNYRFLDSGDDNSQGGVAGSFRHPDANTFALDQLWMTIDKPVTEESRAGFHADYIWGKTAASQGGGSDYDDSGYLYTGYVSYLAPLGDGVEVNAGRLATPLGAEVIQTNQNFNITQGLVFGLQPVNHVGIQAATPLTDNLGLTVGFVNDVYTSNNFDLENNKAFYGQLSLSGDMYGLNVGAIVGQDSTLGCPDADDDCYTSVFDIVMSMDPTDDLSLWLNFDWVRTFGDRTADGDAYAFSAAGRYAITDKTGFASRVEYVRATQSYTGGSLSKIMSLTGTVDHALTDDLKVRFEARWDHILDNETIAFANGENGPSNGGSPLSSRDSQVVGLAEIYYEF
jgi:Putative beta-barrel porin-2, OmpL-like. bbp2